MVSAFSSCSFTGMFKGSTSFKLFERVKFLESQDNTESNGLLSLRGVEVGDVAMLRCCGVAMLRCCDAAMLEIDLNYMYLGTIHYVAEMGGVAVRNTLGF